VNLIKDYILGIHRLVKLSSVIRYLYICSLILFPFIFLKFKAKPYLKEITLKENNLELHDNKSKINFNTLIAPDNRINIGKTFLINDEKYWYHITQISFWREEYFHLNFLEKQLEINNLKIHKLGNNNFAFGTYLNNEVTYACLQNPKEFHHNFKKEKIINANDLDYWLKEFKQNINFVFYAFKPSNYECLIVITPNLQFFENTESEINNKIFSKFIYD